MLFSRSLLFPIFFSAHTASDSDTRNHSRFPAPTGKGQRGISSAAFQHGVTDGSWGEARGVCDFSFPFFFLAHGQTHKTMGPGRRSMVHSAVSRALFDLQALQNDDTDEQAAMPNVGPHTTITHRRGWMARESEEGRDSWEGGFGSSHKATAAQGRRTDKKRKDDRPPPGLHLHTTRTSRSTFQLLSYQHGRMSSRVSSCFSCKSLDFSPGPGPGPRSGGGDGTGPRYLGGGALAFAFLAHASFFSTTL